MSGCAVSEVLHACGDCRGSRCVEHHKANSTIEELRLSYNNIADEGAVALAAGLKARHEMCCLEALTPVFLAIGRVSQVTLCFLGFGRFARSRVHVRIKFCVV